jgi:hypothetical protein
VTRLTTAAVLLLAATHVPLKSAAADAPPSILPQRDVDVTYRAPVAGPGDTNVLQRLRFSAILHRQRLDLPTSGTWMVLDFTAHTMAMVRDQTHEIVDLPAPATAGQPGAGSGFTKLAAASVDGLNCTNWRTIDTRGHETVACYTDDGVLLRASNKNGPMLEAVDVKYGVLPATVFMLPQSYSHQRPGVQP